MTTLLRIDDVAARVQRTRPTIYKMMRRGEFPKPIRLGARSVAWVEDEIEGWIAERIAERDGAASSGPKAP